MCQLKGLDLSGVTIMDFSPEILHVLLEQVAATLQEHNLEWCWITESQHESILSESMHQEWKTNPWFNFRKEILYAHVALPLGGDWK